MSKARARTEISSSPQHWPSQWPSIPEETTDFANASTRASHLFSEDDWAPRSPSMPLSRTPPVVGGASSMTVAARIAGGSVDADADEDGDCTRLPETAEVTDAVEVAVIQERTSLSQMATGGETQ